MNVSTAERRLLDASCATGDRAVQAWRDWSAAVDLDRIPRGEFQLLPLVFRNLESHRLEDVPFRKAYAFYRQTWLANQLALRRLAEIAVRLDSLGIRYAVAGEVAAALVAYPDPGARPITEIAVLVSPADLEPAKALGPEPLVSFHSQLAPGVTRRFPASLLDGARTRQVGGSSLRVLQPADLFLIACDALGTWGVEPRTLVLADAWKLLALLRSETDWERLLHQSTAERANLLVRSALAELEILGAGAVPGPFRLGLEAIRPGVLERLEYRKKHREPGPLPGHELSLLVLRHLRARAAGDTQARLPELPRKILHHVAWRLRSQPHR